MTVSNVQALVGTSNPSSTTMSSAGTGMPAITTPTAGDVILLKFASLRSAGARTVVSVTGVASTWTKIADGARVEFWMGTGTFSGTQITLTQSGSGESAAVVEVVRGLTATTVVTSEATVTGTSLTGADENAELGQYVTVMSTIQAGSATFPSTEVPSGWTTASQIVGSTGVTASAYKIPSGASATHRTDTTTGSSVAMTNVILVIGDAAAAAAVEVTLAGQVGSVTAAMSVEAVVDVEIAGQIGPVTATLNVDALVDVTLAGQLGSVTADVAVEIVPNTVEVALVGQVQPITAAFDVEALVEVALAGQVGPVTASIDAEIAPESLDVTLAGQIGPVTAGFDIFAVELRTTDTTSRTSGRVRSGYAVATWEPPVVPPLVGTPAASREGRIVGLALGAVTMDGTQPTYASVSEASAPQYRTRWVVGGKDVSFLFDVETPQPKWSHGEPLGWGPIRLNFPQIAASYCLPGADNDVYDLRWCAEGKTVLGQRVNDETGEIIATDYRGFVDTFDLGGDVLGVEVLGLGRGKLLDDWVPLPLFREVLDLGRIGWATMRNAGLRTNDRLGPVTGIKSLTFGHSDGLSHAEAICAKAFHRNGDQWTIDATDDGVFSMHLKDRETVHFTIFNDAENVASLRSTSHTAIVYGTGVTPRGQRVMNGVYPNMIHGPAAPYPMLDESTMVEGTTDAETDTANGITLMIRRLWSSNLISLDETDGQTWDAEVTNAIKALQRKAGLFANGMMNPATWAALYSLDVTGYGIKGAQIVPMAQTDETRRYNYSGDGRIMGKNEGFNKHARRKARHIDFESGFTRQQMAEFSEAEIDRGQSWYGTVTITTGAVLIGDVAVGATITEADLMDVRAIRQGMNVRLPLIAGGLLAHVAAVENSVDGYGNPTVELTVDTAARDAMPLHQIILRDRATRNDPAGRGQGNRASSQVKDSLPPWDEFAGILPDDRDLVEGWNRVKVVGGEEGTIARIKTLVTAAGADDGIEYAVAIAGEGATVAQYNHLNPTPLAAGGEDVWWEKAAQFERMGMLGGWGTPDEPCGYGRGKKAGLAVLSGFFIHDAGVAYRCGPDHLIDLMIWVGEPATLHEGRVFRCQREAGA